MKKSEIKAFTHFFLFGIPAVPVTINTITTTAAPVVRSKGNDKKLKIISDVDEDLDSDENDEDDDDENEDDDDDDEDSNSDLLESEPITCPRDCVCSRNLNGYIVATCNR